MSAPATKGDVERELVQAWQALASAVDSFSDAELEQSGVVEGWSVKDLLGHIAFWAQRAAHNLQAVAAGRMDDIVTLESEEAVDEWNERERRQRLDLTLSAVREEWLESFEGAMRALAACPPNKLEEKVEGNTALKSFAMDTYEHYREHLAHLAAWRREMKTTEA